MKNTSDSQNPERRATKRHPVRIDVDYRHSDTYLFTRSQTDNLSELGIFLIAEENLSAGSLITLQFNPTGEPDPFTVEGEVAWVKEGDWGKSQGLGVRFIEVSEETRQRIHGLIRTMAYLE